MSKSEETVVADPLLENHASVLRELCKDPKTRKQALALIKQKYPDTVIPELDVDAQIETRVAERVKPYEESNTTLTKRLEGIERTVARAQFAATHGLAEGEIEEVETFAKENDIRNGAKAVELFRKVSLGTPRATPQTEGAATYLKEIAKAAKGGQPALKSVVFKRANQIIREARGGRLA